MYQVRTFPSAIHAVWLVLGFLSCGILWVPWFFHWLIYYLTITIPDRGKARAEQAAYYELLHSQPAQQTEGNESDDQPESCT